MLEKKRLAWFILFRMAVTSAFLVSTVVLYIKEPANFGDITLPGLFRLILVTYLFSIVSLLVLRFTQRFQQILTYSQVIWDLLLVTILILITGGINSPFSFLYIITIIHASVLLARREAMYTASLCAILYGAILDFQYYGKLNDLGLSQVPAQQHGAYVFYTLFINIVGYFLTAFLTGYLAERARRSENALHEKEIDYEELERLNSSLVLNLDSGLLTLNNEGRIRVFNRYASELTGVSQEQAYDRLLAEVLPPLPEIQREDIECISHGEVEFQHVSGAGMILEYKAAPLYDRDGQRAGVVLALQDITKIKRLEAQLKRTDRLAAIGELSARIAHEIRNPLTSISGSVQLIAQAQTIQESDKKLLDIVMRESERLNELIKDFLAYARPNAPLKIRVQLQQFLSDLIALLKSDTRFDKVTFQNLCPSNFFIEVDRDQFQQVFWNLLVNSAEAMSSMGTISVDAEVIVNEDMGIYIGDVARISITDTGTGMSHDDMKRVFEPFFTTKPNGVGLGLATVYRIIESHEGVISVESKLQQGTKFTIYLPMKEDTIFPTQAFQTLVW